MTNCAIRLTRRTPGIAAALVFAIGLFACDSTVPESYLIPGPSVPSPVPVKEPFVWDTQSDLAVWSTNAVTHGPVSLVQEGSDAFIRIAGQEATALIRGPDLEPAVTGVRGVRLRCRFSSDTYAGVQLFVYFEPLTPRYLGEQYHANGSCDRTPRWTDVDFVIGYVPPVDVRYVYFDLPFGPHGTLDIDAIQLLR